MSDVAPAFRVARASRVLVEASRLNGLSSTAGLCATTCDAKVRERGTHSPARETRALPSAFTIVEILVVTSIILVLAGLVLATSSYVHNKGARSRAEAEIAAMSSALENYKADNGTYPRSPITDALDPTSQISGYSAASLYLYEELSGDRNNDRAADPNATSYFQFKPNMLLPAPPSTNNVTAIRDSFGNSYGYSTMKASNSSSSAGYNPTFDLWSVADGVAGTDQSKWIKNW